MISNKDTLNKPSLESFLTYFIWTIVVIGVLLRIVVYIQANSMYIDEANIARNIFERNFIELTHPLSYEQYAPPVFLWILKASTLLFGYSEYAFRLYPLACSIISIFLFRAVAIRLGIRNNAIWYVLLLLAFGPIYLQYSEVTKQYIPDFLVTLILLYLALSLPVEKNSTLKLFLVWAFTGGIAIWSSMPSVFVLAGVGLYYLLMLKEKNELNKAWFVFLAGALWITQFAAYYFFILAPETNQRALISYHQDFFFNIPIDLKSFVSDIELLLYFIATIGGHLGLPIVFHSSCVIIGVIYLLRQREQKILLLVIPVLAVFLAALLHKYSLINRVSLFCMPLMLLLLGIGLQEIFKVRSLILSLATIVITIICIVDFNALKNFIRPMQLEEMKPNLDFLTQKNISGNQLFVHNLGMPAYIYYTTIHPNKYHWSSLQGAKLLEWNTHFEELPKLFLNNAAILYGWDFKENTVVELSAHRTNFEVSDSNIVKGGRVYIFKKSL